MCDDPKILTNSVLEINKQHNQSVFDNRFVVILSDTTGTRKIAEPIDVHIILRHKHGNPVMTSVYHYN
jgi:hypothetical protein